MVIKKVLIMTSVGKGSLKTRRALPVENRNYEYFLLPVAAHRLGDISRLPISLQILLENILRLKDGRAYTVDQAMIANSGSGADSSLSLRDMS